VAALPDKGKHRLPHLDPDVTIRYRDGHFDVLRLNSESQSYSLTPEAYAVLCLFDGETTRDSAALYAQQLPSNAAGAGLVDQIFALVDHGDFAARPIVDYRALSDLLHREEL
jgi:hypothetical protein